MKIAKILLYLFYGLLGGIFAFGAGTFVIQHPAGTEVFTVNGSGNANASGWIAEFGIRLNDTYMSGADNSTLVSYIDATYWNALTDMVLNDGQIYVGDGSNDPVGVAMSGDVLIDNTGATTIVDISSGLGYHNVSDIPTCSGTDKLTYDGTDLSCASDVSTAAQIWNSTGTSVYLNDTTAKVGIGKTNPATELDVDGGINASTLNISGNAYLATQSGNVGIGTTNPANTLHVIGNINATDSINATVIEAGFIFQNGNKVNDSIILDTTPVGGEVSGTVGNIVLDNDALDDQYYDSESDLTGLLDDNYVDVAGDTMTGDLVMGNTANITLSATSMINGSGTTNSFLIIDSTGNVLVVLG